MLKITIFCHTKLCRVFPAVAKNQSIFIFRRVNSARELGKNHCENIYNHCELKKNLLSDSSHVTSSSYFLFFFFFALRWTTSGYITLSINCDIRFLYAVGGSLESDWICFVRRLKKIKSQQARVLQSKCAWCYNIKYNNAITSNLCSALFLRLVPAY